MIIKLLNSLTPGKSGITISYVRKQWTEYVPINTFFFETELILNHYYDFKMSLNKFNRHSLDFKGAKEGWFEYQK